MTYPEAIKYLESFINYERIPVWPYKQSLRLKRFRDFLATINNPQDALKCIHIAGSKGKGSTCAYITYILRQAGFKVGLYTSPHLSDFRERIRILKRPGIREQVCVSDRDFEGMIPRKELAQAIESLRPAIEKFNLCSENTPLSFFEVYTALALVYFKKKKVDFAVLETGLGGRLDATNVVNPLVCAITPISYEHTQKLGTTLKEIAKEKAGIIKAQSAKRKAQNLIVISAPQEKQAMAVIRNKCRQADVKLYEVGKDMRYQKTNRRFDVEGIFDGYLQLKTRLPGQHQLTNAAVAIAAVEALRFYNLRINVDSIRQGIYNTVWPGRCEVISQSPLVVLDGAQNIASIIALKKTVKEEFRYKRLILILGISNDKDTKGICNKLRDLADEVVLTKADNPRATPPEVLAEYFSGKEIHITADVRQARIEALRIAKREDLILVTGSLFMVGEFRCMI